MNKESMGLAINNYSASYGQLHALRRWALQVEKNPKKLQCLDYGVIAQQNQGCGKCIYCELSGKITVKDRKKITRFYEFIDHSDCEGGYISFNKFGIRLIKLELISIWGNLDELKKEVKDLSKHEDELLYLDQEAWQDFKQDVFQENAVLRFQ